MCASIMGSDVPDTLQGKSRNKEDTDMVGCIGREDKHRLNGSGGKRSLANIVRWQK